MKLPEFLVEEPNGYIHLAGHRIGLQDLVHFYNEGYSAEGLCEVFPTLPLALVHKVIAFYLENQVEVNAYIAASDAEIERQRAFTPRGPDVAELRRRMVAKQAAGA
jgi:uncharacterized protein (DUF433 family)